MRAEYPNQLDYSGFDDGGERILRDSGRQAGLHTARQHLGISGHECAGEALSSGPMV